jgi:hypothetical protein
MKVFHCDHCGQLLFFENVNCIRCGRALAFVPERGDLASLDPRPVDGSPNRWFSPAAGRAFRLCANYTRYNVCNWALPVDDPNELCRACALTRTIPNLSRPGNDRLWYKLEVAKRRLVYTLDQLGLPLKGKSDGRTRDLEFEFLEDVTTGHAQGLISVNIGEADDAQRVKRKIELGEPYRTLVGHFRHESGHYYWDRLVDGTPRLESFRQVFGDERLDYQAALQKNYSEGAPPNWQDRYISAYAAMHPWEDWAETWAHYLHMIDTLETAAACGISVAPPRKDEPTITDVPNPVSEDGVSFDRMMAGWTPITYVLNNLNRGLGNDDAYPFVLSSPSVNKLRFVHDTIAESMRHTNT